MNAFLQIPSWEGSAKRGVGSTAEMWRTKSFRRSAAPGIIRARPEGMRIRRGGGA